MTRTNRWWRRSRRVLTLLCAVLVAGCAAQRPDVGAVVVAPQVVQPPVPQVVLETLPKPPGHFARTLADFLGD